jgi:hypothetical protein
MMIETVANTCSRICHSRFGVATACPTVQLTQISVQEFLSLIQNENSQRAA